VSQTVGRFVEAVFLNQEAGIKSFRSFKLLGIVLLTLSACTPSTTTVPSATPTLPQATATIPPIPTSTNVSPEPQEPPSFSLAERGPYFTGNRVYTFVDDSRGGRTIEVQIYYPAIKQSNDTGGTITRDAVADMSGAPYPLILTEKNTGDYLFKSHLASYGFVMAIVRLPEWYDNWDFGIVDHPRDMLFTLDQIASNSLEGLEGVVNSDLVGVTGYSWGGFYSLALSGVRIDPEYYLDYCERAPLMEPALGVSYLQNTCNLAKKWDEFSTYVGDEITTSDDGLWQPLTDKRIRAVMPMAPDGAWLYGERGLAEVNLPVLIIQATEDNPYQMTESAFIFEHLGTPEKFMISFIGHDHMMVTESEPAKRMKHFAVAFFGYYLQGHEDYADYFSENFVSRVNDLAWGVYKKKRSPDTNCSGPLEDHQGQAGRSDKNSYQGGSSWNLS
jgi:predicted dienelactone hydrolase